MTVQSANLSCQVFNQIMHETLQVENGSPFLTILRTPDQQEIDEWGTEAPIEDFETGFLGKREDELRRFYRQWLAKTPGSLQGDVNEHMMAVLDERSAIDSTMILYWGMKKHHWDDYCKFQPGKPITGNGNLCEDGYIWWKWRVPFKHAFELFLKAEHCDTEVVELFCRPEYQVPDGVVDYETCNKILNLEIPDPLGIVGIVNE